MNGWKSASLVAAGMVIGSVVAVQAAKFSGNKLYVASGDFITMICSSNGSTADETLKVAPNTSFNPTYAELRCIKK